MSAMKAVAAALPARARVKFVDLEQYSPQAEAVQLVPENFARDRHLLPVSYVGKALVVAMANPLDIVSIDELRRLSKGPVEVVAAAADPRVPSSISPYTPYWSYPLIRPSRANRTTARVTMSGAVSIMGTQGGGSANESRILIVPHRRGLGDLSRPRVGKGGVAKPLASMG